MKSDQPLTTFAKDNGDLPITANEIGVSMLEKICGRARVSVLENGEVLLVETGNEALERVSDVHGDDLDRGPIHGTAITQPFHA